MLNIINDILVDIDDKYSKAALILLGIINSVMVIMFLIYILKEVF